MPLEGRSHFYIFGTQVESVGDGGGERCAKPRSNENRDSGSEKADTGGLAQRRRVWVRL